MTTATATQTTIPGTRVACVGRDGARQAMCGNGVRNSIYTGKIYEAKARRDGLLTWRLIGTFGGTRAGLSDTFIGALMDAAEYDWKTVRHGTVCD